MQRLEIDAMRTPPVLKDYIFDAFGPLYDCCPHDYVCCTKTAAWQSAVYLHPPYSELKHWLRNAMDRLSSGEVNKIVWCASQEHLSNSVGDEFIFGSAHSIYIITHPVRFNNKGAPYYQPTMLVVYDRNMPLNYTGPTLHLLQLPKWRAHVSKAASKNRMQRYDHGEIYKK